MTEAEMLEVANGTYELMLSALSLYMSVTSGYLIVAFLVGAKLTRSQMTIISTLYIFMAGVSTYGLYGWVTRGMYFMYEVRALNETVPVQATPLVPAVLIFTLSAGIIASLKFMWDVRHPKTE
jgi:hypothetical protein